MKKCSHCHLSGRKKKTPAQFASCVHISHSVALIFLLKEAKPATGRKHLHCNVWLGCVVRVGGRQLVLNFMNIMSLHSVQGFRGVTPTFLTT